MADLYSTRWKEKMMISFLRPYIKGLHHYPHIFPFFRFRFFFFLRPVADIVTYFADLNGKDSVATKGIAMTVP